MKDEAEHKADSEAVEVGARRCRDAGGVNSDHYRFEQVAPHAWAAVAVDSGAGVGNAGIADHQARGRLLEDRPPAQTDPHLLSVHDGIGGKHGVDEQTFFAEWQCGSDLPRAG